MNIAIYTKPGVLLHKIRSGHYCYWALKYHPKDLKIGDKIWFITEQMVQGYFIHDGYDHNSDENPTITFNSDSWVWLDEFPIYEWHHPKPFQGFKYVNWKILT